MLLQLSRAAPAVSLLSNNAAQQEQQVARGARQLDRFNHRFPDGSYEFRFELDDGSARYERGYFAYINEVKTLMVVGYYSYRMPDGRYITVFYNADQFGYRQNQSITPQVYPDLPRSIEVPVTKDSTTVSPPKKATTPPKNQQFWQPPTVSTTPRLMTYSSTRSGRF
ncbi:uncharacterized protein LOC6564720 [Drosophila grimshawi]|uniref:GH12498 n=1 Tax=Drosophila grimshawi TaxID=7222 RepID=B4JJI8_DROGR|nr:uncharacterized protein LOC6564720 [Drosophila grimshawi]EDV99740.1 GH12498 [Drosophila grimshawi]